jgi:hypothetical protein
MVFIETPHFTRQIIELMPDALYCLVQAELAQNPLAGDPIPGGGGIRKIRAALPGTGKRGGTRIIYYWQKSKDRIFMLVAYAKAHKTDLDPLQTAAFKVLVREIEHHG